MNEENKKPDVFKKSIESTVRSISKKSDISILFGDIKKNSKEEINLPEITKSNVNKDKDLIRGISDSASLMKRYHNSKLHKKLSPIKINSKEIFNEIEHLRCELVGSSKYPGIKKNLLNLELNSINQKLNDGLKLSKIETFKFILKNKILKEKISSNLTKVSDSISKSLIKTIQKD